MRFENTQTFNFEGAFHGMRNPMDSWTKSDSFFGIIDLCCPQDAREEVTDKWIENELALTNRQVERYSNDWENLWEDYNHWLNSNEYLSIDNDLALVAAIGPRDLALAQRLVRAGTEHAKFMRQIFVSVDITAPRFWWTEMDTYKVGTTANSTSTMHKLASHEITMSDFEMQPNNELIVTSGTAAHGGEWEVTYTDYIEDIVDMCENLRQKYINTKDKRYWRALIELLPQSYLQTRTWTANYQILRNIYFQRKDHKLNEWHEFCDWIKELPYGGELITLE